MANRVRYATVLIALELGFDGAIDGQTYTLKRSGFEAIQVAVILTQVHVSCLQCVPIESRTLAFESQVPKQLSCGSWCLVIAQLA